MAVQQLKEDKQAAAVPLSTPEEPKQATAQPQSGNPQRSQPIRLVLLPCQALLAVIDKVQVDIYAAQLHSVLDCQASAVCVLKTRLEVNPVQESPAALLCRQCKHLQNFVCTILVQLAKFE